MSCNSVDSSDKRCDDGGGGSNSGKMTLSKKESTSCEQNNIDTITEGIDSVVSILDNKSTCANCGKVGDDINNTCNKCKMVKYCNAACKKKHKKKHKKECERYQRLVAEKHDEKLFKQPPAAEDCSICFLRLPTLESGKRYMSCCGKLICSGCSYAPLYDNQGNKVDNKKCPFCRIPTPNSAEEKAIRIKARIEAGDPIAIYNLGVCYSRGTNGFPQDQTKALNLWHRAGELGYTEAYISVGYAYENDDNDKLKVDEKKAKHYTELAAMSGSASARFNLGIDEEDAGNFNRAIKHYMIAARDGDSKSLEAIKYFYSNGHATKDDYTTALQAYQEYLVEIKSKQRDEAAAAREDHHYY